MKKKKDNRNFIIGIDEVGRGALAGPVTVAAFLLPRNFQFPNSNFQKISKIKLKDSKKLSPRQREIWFKCIKENQNLFYAIASTPPKLIDKINISQAANLAATNALQALIKNYKLKIKNCRVYLDGGLHLNTKTLNTKYLILNTKTIIRGDEKIPAITLASIVAKVTRDCRMKRAHKKYPTYDFINNVGYGTKKHIKAIKKSGHSPIHRKSFKIK